MLSHHVATDFLIVPLSLILGWSDKVVAIVNQLCNANESEGGLPIVILSEKDKVRVCADECIVHAFSCG